MLGYLFKRLRKYTLHYPPLSTTTLHFQSKPPSSYLALLAPFHGWVIPFHWTITPRPSLTEFDKRRKGPAVGKVGSILCAGNTDTVFISQEIPKPNLCQIPLKSWNSFLGVVEQISSQGGIRSIW